MNRNGYTARTLSSSGRGGTITVQLYHFYGEFFSHWRNLISLHNIRTLNSSCYTHVVGRTHTIVRLQTRIRRKDGTENFGGFVYVLDGFLQGDFVLWGFMRSNNFSLFSGYHAEGYHAPPIPYGYHAQGYHALTDTFKLTGYHVCRVTTPELPRSTQTSGYRRVITPAGSF